MGYIRGLLNREPAMMMATALGLGAVALPFIIVPVRRQLGLPTYQWDADPNTHPFLFKYADHYRRHAFDDAELLAKWAQHDEYKYLTPLTPKTPEERDFPAVRQRLREVEDARAAVKSA